jgi:WD40 repeat protein
VSKLRAAAAVVLALALVGGGPLLLPLLATSGERASAQGPALPEGGEVRAVRGDPKDNVDRGQPPAPPVLGEVRQVELKPRWESCGGHRGNEWLIAFSPDGKLAFFDQQSGRVFARDTRTWKKTGQLLVNAKDLKPHRGGVSVTSPDGKLVAWSVPAGDSDKDGRRIRLDEVRTNRTLAQTPARRTHPSWQPPLLQFTPDGRTLLSVDFHSVVLWDVPTLKKRRTLGPVNNYPKALVVSPDGGTLCVTCGTWTNEDQIWDLKTGTMKGALGGHEAQVWSLAFAPDGKTLVSRGNDPVLKVWDTATGLATLTIPLHFDSRSAIQKVVYHPKGGTVAVGEGSVVRLYDVRTGKPGAVLKGHTSRVNDLAFSPDGTRLVSVSGRPANRYSKVLVFPEPKDEPGEIICWDVGTKKMEYVRRVYKQGCSAVAWSPDGRLVATGGHPEADDGLEDKGARQTLRLWTGRTGRVVQAFDAPPAGLLAFNPDGKTVAHGGTGQPIRIFDIRTGQTLRTLQVTTRAAGMAFRKDGRLLAVVGGWGGVNIPNPGTIELWNPHTGECVARRNAHDTEITTVAFHPDGTSIATGGSDRALWLWEIVPGARK